MIHLNFNDPFPTLLTGRLRLREMEEKDAGALLAMRSDPAVLRYVPIEPMKDLEQSLAFIHKMHKAAQKNESVQWTMALQTTDELVGTACYWNIEPENRKAETGYMLHPAHTGKGYMREAITELIRYGFDVMNLHKITAVVHPENTRSIQLLQHFKFQQEGLLRDNLFFNGEFLDEAVYALLDVRRKT